MDQALRDNAGHVDHDMALFLNLHRELQSPRFGLYPETVRRALHVAYATLLRSLLPFFHCGRPQPPEDKTDLCASQYVPASGRLSRRHPGWSTRDSGSSMQTSWRLI